MSSIISRMTLLSSLCKEGFLICLFCAFACSEIIQMAADGLIAVAFFLFTDSVVVRRLYDNVITTFYYTNVLQRAAVLWQYCTMEDILIS